MWERVQGWLELAWVEAAAILLGSLVTALLAQQILSRTLGRLARHTRTDLDDRIAEALQRPIFLSVLFYGLSWITRRHVPAEAVFTTIAALETVTITVWALAAFKIVSAILESLSRSGKVIQRSTLPAFDMLGKICIVGGAIYFVFLTWDIDLTAWLASAGIVGIAVGFAAKDTLANLFSGIFILADAPYKLGDWIIVDNDLRGRVTRVGMRSTRLITRDDIEITIPNALLGNSKIVNEAGGDIVQQRVKIFVSVAYGSDIDLVEKVLLSCAEGMDEVASHPPQIRFRAMGASGLDFELLVWLTDHSIRGLVVSRLNARVYKALYANGIEIPFPKRDVYIRALPDGFAEAVAGAVDRSLDEVDDARAK